METLPRVVWRAEKNGTPDGATSADHWWIVNVDEEIGNSLLVKCNQEAATMAGCILTSLEVTRAHRATWVKSSEVWRAADRMPPTVGARVEISEHTGAVRVGTVLEPELISGLDDADHLTKGPWMVDTGTHPIVWWRPVKWALTTTDVHLFLEQPIWRRVKLLKDSGGDGPEPLTSAGEHRGGEWGALIKSMIESPDGDLPGFLTALRALAK